MARSYQDGLRAETRRRILAAARQAEEARLVGPRPAWRLVPQLAAAAAVALLLAAPALYRDPAAGQGVTSQVEGLEVRADGDRIVLTWDSTGEPRRVLKATSREQLSDLSRLPYKEIKGGHWVDDHLEEASVVYYIVQ